MPPRAAGCAAGGTDAWQRLRPGRVADAAAGVLGVGRADRGGKPLGDRGRFCGRAAGRDHGDGRPHVAIRRASPPPGINAGRGFSCRRRLIPHGSPSIMALMPTLETALVERTKRLAEIERQAAAVRAEIEALRVAARIIGVSVTDSDGVVSEGLPRRAGKPAGAISQKWRNVLADMLPIGARHSMKEIQAIAAKHGMALAEQSVRDRVRKFIGAGYMARTAEGHVSVTDDAASRFGLKGQPNTGLSALGVAEGDANTDGSAEGRAQSADPVAGGDAGRTSVASQGT